MRHMSIKAVARSVAAVGLSLFLGFAAAGCGSGHELSKTAVGEPPVEQRALLEFAEMYQQHVKQTGQAPKQVKDLAKLAPAFTVAALALQNRDVIAFWGDPTPSDSKASEKVLAYEKKVPQEGGSVLMGDGMVKSMTAQEFEAAPKAGTLSPTPKSKK